MKENSKVALDNNVLNRGQLIMSLTDIKTKSQGFTIVELLIVVVVIAILAAITIVSYNGITNRANASAAASAAATVQKKAELYASDGSTGKYPAAFADLTAAGDQSKTYYLTGVTNGTPTPENGKNTVRYQVCGTGASTSAPSTIGTITAVTGGIVSYFNYTDGSGVKNITLGQTSGTVGSNNVGCAS